MFAKTLAALGLLICIYLAVRMALPHRQTLWLDARLRRAQWLVMDGWKWLRSFGERRRIQRKAHEEAEAAIRKARSASKMVEGEWDGNVYRPKSFGDSNKKPDRRDLH